jgi:transposase
MGAGERSLLEQSELSNRNLETTMAYFPIPTNGSVSLPTDVGVIFVSLELSRATWLVTSLSPAGGGRMSRYAVRGGDVPDLLSRFGLLQSRAFERTGMRCSLVVIHEAGLDGFWLHRVLEQEGIESHVVDPASIATSRRARRAKTDRVDGETLVRTLMAFKRGEPRVCAMVRPPSPEAEDRRQISRERRALIAERISHVNRIKGLLFAQGISSYEPIRRDRRQRLETLQTGDGRPLPDALKQRIDRELDRLELLLDQIRTVEGLRDDLLAARATDHHSTPVILQRLKGVGPEAAMTLWSEGLFRHFDNRRQLAAFAGLAPTPWQSGTISREQGVSKAGNARLRATMIQLSWLWLRNQPTSALSVWFHRRVGEAGGRSKLVFIVALARKLLVSLWRFAKEGVVPDGAVLSAS